MAEATAVGTVGLLRVAGRTHGNEVGFVIATVAERSFAVDVVDAGSFDGTAGGRAWNAERVIGEVGETEALPAGVVTAFVGGRTRGF